jgi:DNA-binding NarL/FixJ family response regulator
MSRHPRRVDASRLQPTPTTRTAVVLAVEDDPQIRTLYRNALAGLPALRLETARDGEEGLLRAWELAPALILADLLMPGIDGATFCRLLRAHPVTAAVPIVAVSGADLRAERAQTLRAQCAAWLGKPFELDDLVETVRRWLPHPPPPGLRNARPWSPLTPREWEVAVLVARGRTNRGIAADLVLTEGTAANHVRRILLRLGLSSRVQLALWVAQHPERRSALGLG